MVGAQRTSIGRPRQVGFPRATRARRGARPTHLLLGRFSPCSLGMRSAISWKRLLREPRRARSPALCVARRSLQGAEYNGTRGARRRTLAGTHGHRPWLYPGRPAVQIPRRRWVGAQREHGGVAVHGRHDRDSARRYGHVPQRQRQAAEPAGVRGREGHLSTATTWRERHPGLVRGPPHTPRPVPAGAPSGPGRRTRRRPAWAVLV